MEQTQLKAGSKVGLVGWKNFTSRFEDNQTLFDVSYYIVETIQSIVGEKVYNATYLFIGENGARCTNNVNEIAHYEFGAALASDCMLKAMDALTPGISEMELGNILNAYGQKNSVVTIAASGPRFIKANLYPTENTVKVGDSISLTVGYKGGLSSRAGYAVHEVKELEESQQAYVDDLVKPYFSAIATWLEQAHCGMQGGQLYELMQETMPQERYHWGLCPGHLTSDEEWLSSNIYKGSKETIQSGMLFQTDIIPSLSGYAGTSVESTVLFADEALRKEIQDKEPELWQRISKRIAYMKNELHIELNEDILPMCSTVAYLRPFLLNKEKAMQITH